MTRWLYVSALATLMAAGLSLYVFLARYDRLPAELPTHWNVNGEVDGTVGKDTALWLIPALMAGMIGLTLLLPWLSPRHFEVDRFRGTYGYVMMLLVALLGYLHAVILLGTLHGDAAALNRWLFGGLFLFFALLGNVLGQVRRNFWIGVRTPWTLASESVWIQTHRVAAWLFVAAGVAGFVAVLLGVPFLWCFVGLMAAALLPVLYSLVLYKRLEKEGRL